MAKTRLSDLTYSLVNQRTDVDCGVACVAMYARVTYEEAMAVVTTINSQIPTIGLSRDAMRRALKHFGMDVRACFKFFDGLPTIVSVPSLNTEASMHYVFWDGNTRTVLDPRAGVPGKKAYTKELLYRGWSDTLVDINAAAEGWGMDVDKVVLWATADREPV